MSNSICYNCQTLIPKHTHLQSQFDHFMYLYKKKTFSCTNQKSNLYGCCEVHQAYL